MAQSPKPVTVYMHLSNNITVCFLHKPDFLNIMQTRNMVLVIGTQDWRNFPSSVLEKAYFLVMYRHNRISVWLCACMHMPDKDFRQGKYIRDSSATLQYERKDHYTYRFILIFKRIQSKVKVQTIGTNCANRPSLT